MSVFGAAPGGRPESTYSRRGSRMTDTGYVGAAIAESTSARIRAVFADAGCVGWLHARRCDGSAGEVSVGGNDRVVIASKKKATS